MDEQVYSRTRAGGIGLVQRGTKLVYVDANGNDLDQAEAAAFVREQSAAQRKLEAAGAKRIANERLQAAGLHGLVLEDMMAGQEPGSLSGTQDPTTLRSRLGTAAPTPAERIGDPAADPSRQGPFPPGEGAAPITTGGGVEPPPAPAGTPGEEESEEDQVERAKAEVANELPKIEPAEGPGLAEHVSGYTSVKALRYMRDRDKRVSARPIYEARIADIQEEEKARKAAEQGQGGGE